MATTFMHPGVGAKAVRARAHGIENVIEAAEERPPTELRHARSALFLA